MRLQGIRWQLHHFNHTKEHLLLEEFQHSELQTGEVWIKMLASPINPADLNILEDKYGITHQTPFVPGNEGCGVVEQSESSQFQKGDLVILLHTTGAWASHICCHESQILKLPPHIHPHQAAMLKVNPATAYLMLLPYLQSPNAWIALNAANSNVGQCLIQIAHLHKLSSSSFLRNMNIANHVLQLGTTEVFEDSKAGHHEAQNKHGGAWAHVGMNAVGGESASSLVKHLLPNTTLITYGAMAKKPVTISNSALIFQNIQLQGFWLTSWLKQAPETEIHHVYQCLAYWVIQSKLTQAIHATVPFEQLHEAIDLAHYSSRNGKILIEMSH